MTDKKEPQLPNEMLIAEALIRLKALETVLIKNGLCTQAQLNVETKVLSELLTKSILEKAKVPGNIDEIIKGFTPKSSGN